MASEGAIIPQLVESITQSSSSPSTACSAPMAGGHISSSAHSTIPCQTEVVLDEKTKKELFTDTFCRVCGAVLQFEAHRNAHYEGKKHAQKVRLYFLKQELEELTYKKKAKVDHVDFNEEKGLSQDKNKFCSLCNMVFSSPVVAQSHYIGKIHAKKLKQMSGEQGEWSTGPEENAHVETADAESSPILSPLTEKSNQQHQDVSADTSCGDNAIDLSDPNKYCKLCCATFNKPLVAQQHYSGKKHARNEARRKMMEEMGDTWVPMDSGGEGIFVCPICSITLTSIEMYQSHMQGNKHQIKESMVANIMKTTKRTYDSFQDELADYIKVQKARGLEPKTQFRQDSSEEEEPVPAPIHQKPSPRAPYKYPPPPHHPKPYPAYNPHHPPRLSCWEKPYWPQRPTPKLPNKTIPHKKHPRSSPESSDDTSSDESSGSYKKERRHKKEHKNKDRKHHHSKTRRENESSERKKRKTEDSDSGKDDSEREKKAEELSADKSKHRKEKKKREEQTADKEGKKHKKVKKIEDQRTEEEMLWDESILGF